MAHIFFGTIVRGPVFPLRISGHWSIWDSDRKTYWPRWKITGPDEKSLVRIFKFKYFQFLVELCGDMPFK